MVEGLESLVDVYYASLKLIPGTAVAPSGQLPRSSKWTTVKRETERGMNCTTEKIVYIGLHRDRN